MQISTTQQVRVASSAMKHGSHVLTFGIFRGATNTTKKSYDTRDTHSTSTDFKDDKIFSPFAPRSLGKLGKLFSALDENSCLFSVRCYHSAAMLSVKRNAIHLRIKSGSEKQRMRKLESLAS